MDLAPLLEPRSIAVVGATDRPDAYGDTILRNLERLGFDGPLYGVNPGRRDVRGIECVPSVDELPEAVDAVAVAIPAAGVPETLEAIARRGCRGAVVVSAGFGEVERGAALESRLRDIALSAGLPVCGPNGNGVVSFAAGAGIWGDSVQAHEPGPVALISQSGNVAVNALGSRRGIGFHTVVSTGNGTVCDAADWLLALSERDGIGSIALFLEGDGDGAKLAEGLARCAEREVRVVVLKVGSSAAGAAAAAAHTGALAGDQRVFRALVEEAGATLARDPHELLELARVLGEPRARPSLTGGLAVLTCSGGDSGVAADEAERLGLGFPALAKATRERLGELLPEAATIGNPLDYTSQIWAETERLAAIVETVGADPAVDQLLIFHDTPEDLSAEAGEGWAATRAGLVRGANASEAAAIFASTLPDLIRETVIIELGEAGIASVGGLSTAMLCARELRRAPGDPDRLRSIAAAAALCAPEIDPANPSPGSTPGGGGASEWLGEAEAKELLRDRGIPVPDGRTASDPEGAAEVAAEIGYPVALKLSSPSLRHKSERGAIALGIGDGEELAVAAERLLGLPEAAGGKLLVERMARPGVELVVAARTDGIVPALVIGLGGIWTEALGDVAIVPLPASPERVTAALHGLRGAALLTGGRGSEPVDVGSVARVSSCLGELALEEGLDLVELNPLIAGPDGCSAVDALVRGAG